MPIYVGGQEVQKVFVGTTEVSQVYQGTNELFSGGGAPTGGLIAKYDFAGNLNDTSGTGTVYNATADAGGATVNYRTSTTSGEPSTYIEFTGTGNTIFRTNLPTGQAVTSESFWINEEMTVGDDVNVLSTDIRRENQNEIFVFYTTTGGVNTTLDTNLQNPTAQWVHYVAVFNNGAYELYRNGISIFTATLVANAVIRLDNLFVAPDDAAAILLGPVRVYSTALTQAEVTALAQEFD